MQVQATTQAPTQMEMDFKKAIERLDPDALIYILEILQIFRQRFTLVS